jgi:hypothetical protein
MLSKLYQPKNRNLRTVRILPELPRETKKEKTIVIHTVPIAT